MNIKKQKLLIEKPMHIHPITCICGHRDNRHADIDDGTILGKWGAGKCELCNCSHFECKECAELEKSK